jgi:hypothetical protein
MIQRARSQPLKSILYCEREFTAIYKKGTRFLASAAMYMGSALLYSKPRDIIVERKSQKRNLSSTRLRWCGIVTFF